jgi:hypothetical protein
LEGQEYGAGKTLVTIGVPPAPRPAFLRPREGIIFLLESAARLFCRPAAAQEILETGVNI